jgi:hypothetical protein
MQPLLLGPPTSWLHTMVQTSRMHPAARPLCNKKPAPTIAVASGRRTCQWPGENPGLRTLLRQGPTGAGMPVQRPGSCGADILQHTFSVMWCAATGRDRLLQRGPAVCALPNRVAQPGCSHGLSAGYVLRVFSIVVLLQHGQTQAMKLHNSMVWLNLTSGTASTPAEQHIRMHCWQSAQRITKSPPPAPMLCTSSSGLTRVLQLSACRLLQRIMPYKTFCRA